MAKNDENELIDRAVAGDEDAYWEIVNTYKNRLFRAAYAMLRNESEAEDIVQDVFIKMHRSLKNFRRQSSIYTWLYRITINLSCNRLRSRSGRAGTSLDELVDDKNWQAIMTDPDRTPEQRFMRGQTVDAVSSAIDALSPKLKEVIILRYYDDKDYQEIAELLNTNIGTIKSRLFAAREALKKKLNITALFNE